MNPASPRAWRTDPAQTLSGPPGPGPAPRRAWLGWLLAAVVAAAYASQTAVSEPRAGEALPIVGTLASAPTAAPASLRLATLGLPRITGFSRDWGQIAAALEPADIAALQGVQGATLGWRANDAQALGESLARGWLFAPATRRWGGDGPGVGLLSARPLIHWQTIPLPGSDPALATLAVAPLGSGSVRVLIVDAGDEDSAVRQQQLGGAIALFESLAEPAALVGDLGMGRDDPQLAALLARPGVRDAVYTPLGLSPAGHDWIITRGLRTKGAGVGEAGTAEHPLLWADVEPAR